MWVFAAALLVIGLIFLQSSSHPPASLRSDQFLSGHRYVATPGQVCSEQELVRKETKSWPFYVEYPIDDKRTSVQKNSGPFMATLGVLLGKNSLEIKNLTLILNRRV